MMQLVARGIISHAEPATPRAVQVFPSLVVLPSGALLAMLRTGSAKDSADDCIESYRSDDGGASWRLIHRITSDISINGAQGGIRVLYVTVLASGRLLAAAMLIDHTTYPGQPLFNAETEGCLPMYILLAESGDEGATWSAWRHIPLPDAIGPASLTNPIIERADGVLLMSIENNKHYLDSSPWKQKVVLFHSHDSGQTWADDPFVAGEDPSGRIFNWDLRLGQAPDGTLGSFAWTYDSQTTRYLNIHRRISRDGGYRWSAAEDLGFADQASHPAILPDGRVVLAYVDRFGTHSIRARLAANIDAPFDPASDIELYALNNATNANNNDTGALLADMGLWTFGLPYAEALPDGDVLVLYYAGTTTTMHVHWARLRLHATTER